MSDYPPYVNAYGGIPKLFGEIRKAAVPLKFTNDFIATVLGLKSSSFRAMIPMLKRLGFIDGNNAPTQAYKDYRDESRSVFVMAQQIRHGYADVFNANEFAYRLSKTDLTAKLTSLLGAGKDDKTIPNVVGTFCELCKLANFEDAPSVVTASKITLQQAAEPSPSQVSENRGIGGGGGGRLGISYTINLNLPATTDVEVFNAIFKSLREHILLE